MAFPPRPPRGAFNPRFRKEQQQEHRTNHMIKVPEVRLAGDNIEVGIYPTADALKMAQDQQLVLGVNLTSFTSLVFDFAFISFFFFFSSYKNLL